MTDDNDKNFFIIQKKNAILIDKHRAAIYRRWNPLA